MIVFMEYQYLPYINLEDTYVFNLSSLKEGFTMISVLPDPSSINCLDEREFDQAYFNFIMSNDFRFYEVFSKMIYPIYCGKNVVVLVQRNMFYDTITESLLKLIQQRYGYNNIAIINEPSDIDYIPKDNNFTVNGVFNLDQDKERYTRIYATRNMGYFNYGDGNGGNDQLYGFGEGAEAEYV